MENAPSGFFTLTLKLVNQLIKCYDILIILIARSRSTVNGFGSPASMVKRYFPYFLTIICLPWCVRYIYQSTIDDVLCLFLVPSTPTKKSPPNQAGIFLNQFMINRAFTSPHSPYPSL